MAGALSPITQAMKNYLAILILLIVASTASAVLLSEFAGYDWLEQHSPDIFVARCVTNPPTLLPSNSESIVNAFSIQVVSSIKGTNRYVTAPLSSMHWLNVGDNYLIYGRFEDGICYATEEFRVIPLGRELWAGTFTNLIAGKPLPEQLQILLKRALENVNRNMNREREEKQRLEEGVMK